jgi:hypothetical protein
MNEWFNEEIPDRLRLMLPKIRSRSKLSLQLIFPNYGQLLPLNGTFSVQLSAPEEFPERNHSIQTDSCHTKNAENKTQNSVSESWSKNELSLSDACVPFLNNFCIRFGWRFAFSDFHQNWIK